MHPFTIPCDFAGTKRRWPVWVGEPAPDAHPLEAQAAWLRRPETGGSLPLEVMDSFKKLQEIARENDVSFEELCIYAMGEAEAPQESDAPTVGEDIGDTPIPEIPAAPLPDPVAPGPGAIRRDEESGATLWHDAEADAWLRWDRAHQAWVPTAQ